MRTLGTQLRLRRLIRVHSEYLGRLRGEPGNRDLVRAAVVRLRALLDDVRGSWAQEAGLASSIDESELDALRRHVTRTLAAAEAAVAEMDRPNPDFAWLGGQFRESAAPLLFFLRGLEDMPEHQIHEYLAPIPLGRTA